MERWEYRYLGFADWPGDLTPVEIDQFCSFDTSQVAALKQRKDENHRLGLALQMCFLRMTGRVLNSATQVAPQILKTIAAQIDIPAPDLLSLRALYVRLRTLHEHQREAMATLFFERASKRVERGLTAFLRREAVTVIEIDLLLQRGRIWLYQRRYLIPNNRTLMDLVTSARRYREAEMERDIAAAVSEEIRSQWLTALSGRYDEGEGTRFEALQKTPPAKNIITLETQAKKIRELKALGADKLDLTSLPVNVLRHYAGRIARRSPRKLHRIREPSRTIELACFLRLRLLELSDQVAQMADRRISDAWRQAQQGAFEMEGRLLARHQSLVLGLHAMAGDKKVSDAAFRASAEAQMASLISDTCSTRAARTRRLLARQSKDLVRILSAIKKMNLEKTPDLSAEAIDNSDWTDRAVASRFVSRLGKPWRDAVVPGDASAIIGVSIAARAILIKRALRTGAIGIVHSLEHRAPSKRLIPESLWMNDRVRLSDHLNAGDGCAAFIGRLSQAIGAGLQSLSEAIEAGDIRIKAGRLVIPRLGADPDVARATPYRRAMYAAIGEVQLPDIVVEMDALTNFSSTVLRRAPRTEKELITVYAALLALGTDLSATAANRMIHGLDADSISRMMQVVIDADCLRAAANAVEEIVRSCPISSLWGSGATASADLMSLEASRHLWSTRTDPRRRVYAVGTYSHLLDQWGIIYDQPIVLNKRQAGAAIEGALRQEAADLEKLAVDTHGCTHFAMSIAKLCGFDLCPRLAGLSGLKFYLPRGAGAPEKLRGIASATVSRDVIEKGWDELLRIAASIKEGWCSATYALEKFGSASRGTSAYEAGVAVGKLLRTLFLCDYLSNKSFRRDIGRTLSRGESLHTLQRAIYTRPLSAKAGRDAQELKAISNALTLLTNIVMAWNARHMQAVFDAAPSEWPDWALRHIAPVGHAHINMRGVMTFDLKKRRGHQPAAGQNGNSAAAP